MIDEIWIKRLAQTMQGEPDQAPRIDLEPLFLRSIDELYEDAQDAVESFNTYAPRGKRLSVLPMSGPRRGFFILLDQWRLSCYLEQKVHEIRAELHGVSHFISRPLRGLRFKAMSDAFGSLRFYSEDGLLLDRELLLKRLLEELVRNVRPK